jgi:aspartyl-tRNA(Asn)/glutamyl-tRNA(Gln) amidotransferase subunit C
VSISLDEVRRIAALARLGISDDRAREIAVELNGILAHMEVLAAVDTSAVATGDKAGSGDGMPLRLDRGPPISLARAPSAFAPAFGDGFFLVPRLATHEDAAS